VSELHISDGITPELKRIAGEIQNPRRLMAATGKRMEKVYRDHFLTLDRKPNEQGWPKRHFWSRVVRSATSLTEVTAEKAVVTMASPELVHKVQGGTVTPKRGRALAAPASALAYKTGSPRDWDTTELEFVPLKSGGLVGMLVRTQRDVISFGKKGVRRVAGLGGEIMYWLFAKVFHRPQPDALPKQETVQAAVLQEARALLARILRTRQ
jgi:hypothetical protein